MIRIVGLSLVGLAGLGLAACGSTEPGTPVMPVTSVTVSPGPLALLIGVSQQMIARDQAGNALAGQAVAWTTSAPAIATVSATGLVGGVSAGAATITATAEGKIGSAAVSVVAVALASVVAGGAHTCALTTSGAAYCWGRGESGQLGVPAPSTLCAFDTESLACSAIPVAVQGGLTFTHLAPGGTHTCGLTADGSVYCWGLNSIGQVGDNSTSNRFVPVPVATAVKFVSLAAGAFHTCGLTSSGSAYCWGLNNRGQLGDGTTDNRSAPVAVSGGFAFQMLTAGGYLSANGHTCGVVMSGAAYCWGDNRVGQLGIGAMDEATRSTPAAVSGGLTFVSLAAGLDNHTCGLTTAGAAYCWGNNAWGALGDGTQIHRAVPVQVTGGITFAQVVSGGFVGHSCGLTSSGNAYCWGDNEVGAIGDGTTVVRLAPTAVLGELAFTSLDAGYRHTCGRASTGIVYCWGSGRAGQIGTNGLSVYTLPAKVVGQA